jgi:hypothetical protein
MRFLDSKGRVFGIINLLDLLVILIFVVLIFTASLNVLNRPKDNAKDSAELLVKIFARVPNDVAHNSKIFKPDDRVLAGNAAVEKVLEVRPVVGDGAYSDMIILLKANCVILNNEYYCANAPIKVNAMITIANTAYILNNATIIDVEKKAK